VYISFGPGCSIYCYVNYNHFRYISRVDRVKLTDTFFNPNKEYHKLLYITNLWFINLSVLWC